MQSFIVTSGLFASKWKRFLNYIIDCVIKCIVAFLLLFIILIITNLLDSPNVSIWVVQSIIFNEVGVYVLFLFASIVYYNIFEMFTGRSLGKYITGTKIVLEDGSKPKPKDIFIRTLSRYIPFDDFSFLGYYGRGLHDSLSKTFVVNVKDFEEQKKSHFDFQQLGKVQEEEEQ